MSELIHTPVRKAQIFSGNANPELAQLVAQELDTELSPRILEPFSDGEIKCQLLDTVRGNYVFIIQSHGGGQVDVNTAIAEHQLLCDAAAGGSAAKVIAIAPYFGYSRQDRKAAGRESVGAKLLCTTLKAAGATGIVGIDLHSTQTQEFFDGPFDNLTAAPILRQAIMPELEEGVVVVSPDAGRNKAAARHRKELSGLGASVAYIDKSRPTDTINQVEALDVVGDVEGRQCLIVDDMIDTAGTISAAANLLAARGATDVLTMATHPVLSGNAISKLTSSAIRQLVVTDTLALSPDQLAMDNIRVVSVAKIIAGAIDEIFRDGSISKLFNGEDHS